MGVLSNKIKIDELKPGDHIYSWRNAYVYAHHGFFLNPRFQYQEGFAYTDNIRSGVTKVIERLAPDVSFAIEATREVAQFRGKIGRFGDFTAQTAVGIMNPGIYIGDGVVIHYTRGGGQEVGTGTVLDRVLFSSSPSPPDTPCTRCGDQSHCSGVISSCINCFLAGGDLYLFHYSVSHVLFVAKARGGTCTLAKSDPPEDVLHRANYLLQNGFGGYNIFKNNCEDFAIYCKTGLLLTTMLSVGRSGQAVSFCAAATAVVASPLRFLTTSIPGLAVVGCTIYCLSRLLSDIGVRRDVIKISAETLVAESAGGDEPNLSMALAAPQ